jgi:hypothetical protein
MPLLLESPTDQGHQNLLGQHLRTMLEVADELVSQMPLEAQIWATQVRQELHKGVELIEQELELLGLQQICALRRALDERDRQIIALSPLGPPTLGGGDTLDNLFEDLEGLSVQSAPETLTVSEPQVMADVVPSVEVVEAELQTIEAEPPLQTDLTESGTLRQEFQQLQADLASQKQQLASIISVVDQQKAENQQLQSLVSSLEEKLSQKETDLEKSMIRSLLLEAGLDPDVA